MRIRRTLLFGLLLALLTRAIVPVGHMPGSIASGSWVVLCPSNSAATFALLELLEPTDSSQHHAHNHSHHHTDYHTHRHTHRHGASEPPSADHSQHTPGAKESCPLATALGQAALTDTGFVADPLDAPSTDTPLPSIPPRIRLAGYHYEVRGPPLA